MSFIIVILLAVFAFFIIYVVAVTIIRAITAIIRKQYGKAATNIIALLVFLFLLYKLTMLFIDTFKKNYMSI